MTSRSISEFRALTIAVALSIGLVSWSEVGAQAPRASVIAVTVTDAASGLALPQVDVRIKGSTDGALTDSAGVARLTNLKKGRYEVEARRLGMSPSSAKVSVTGTDSVTVTLAMISNAQSLAKVEVRDNLVASNLAEFEDRRKRGNGRFITQEQIQQAQGGSLDALVNTHFPRVRILDGRIFTPAFSGINNSRGGRCDMVAYLDGIKLAEGTADNVVVRNLAAIEFYTMNQVPAQYRLSDATSKTNPTAGNLRCGTILFWSK